MSALAELPPEDRTNALHVIRRAAANGRRRPGTKNALLAIAAEVERELQATAGEQCPHCSGSGFETTLTGRAIGRCRPCKGVGRLPDECPRLGRLICVRKDEHDPHAVGGHEYAASSFPDAHDRSEADAERRHEQ